LIKEDGVAAPTEEVVAAGRGGQPSSPRLRRRRTGVAAKAESRPSSYMFPD